MTLEENFWTDNYIKCGYNFLNMLEQYSIGQNYIH